MSAPGPYRITHGSDGKPVGALAPTGEQLRHEAIRASDRAHAKSAAVAAKGHSATSTDHTEAYIAHAQAANLANKAGHRLAMQGHQELASAHMDASGGFHQAAAKAFANYAKDSEQAHYNVLATQQRGGEIAKAGKPSGFHPPSAAYDAERSAAKGHFPAPGEQRIGGTPYQSPPLSQRAYKAKQNANHLTSLAADGTPSQHEAAANANDKAAKLHQEMGDTGAAHAFRVQADAHRRASAAGGGRVAEHMAASQAAHARDNDSSTRGARRHSPASSTMRGGFGSGLK